MGARRRPVVRDQHRAEVARLILTGKGTWAISKELGVSQRTIEKDVAFLRNEWRVNREADIDGMIGEELRRVARLEQAAWAAWESSKERKRKTTTHSRRIDGKLVPGAVIVSDEEREGDPRFLETVNRCIERRSSLLGLGYSDRKGQTGGDLTLNLPAMLDQSIDRAYGEPLALEAPAEDQSDESG